MKISKIGIAWFTSENYDEFRKLFTDGDGLPSSYEKWLKKAEAVANDLRRNGNIVVKANLDLKTFPEWCRSRRLNINADARKLFASEFAAFGDGH